MWQLTTGIASSIVSGSICGMALSNADKVRENRLRHAAERQGFLLSRSRRRDPYAIGYGRYQLTRNGAPITPTTGWDLDAVEAFLYRRHQHTTEEIHQP